MQRLHHVLPPEGGCGRAGVRDRPWLHSHSRQMGHPSSADVLSAAAHRGLAATDAERVRRAIASSLADNTRRTCLGHWRERDFLAGRVERIRRQEAALGRSGPGRGPHTVHADIAAAASVVAVAKGPGTTRPSTAGTRPACTVRSCRGSARFPPPATARAGRAGARRGSPPWLVPPFALSSRPLPHSGDCGPVGARAGSRSCGENGQTHGFRGGVAARVAACAHESQVRQGPVRQAVSDPVGTTGAAEAHGRRGGSDPPENGPRLRSRTFRGGRSRDLSLQEGWAAPGPWMRPSRMFDAHVNATDV